MPDAEFGGKEPHIHVRIHLEAMLTMLSCLIFRVRVRCKRMFEEVKDGLFSFLNLGKKTEVIF